MFKISLWGKRLIASILLSLLAGYASIYITNASLISTLADSFVVGLIIGIGGIFLRHPVFGFPTPAFLRGTCFGVFGGLSTILTSEHPWIVLIIFLIMGSLIDFFVTKATGEGTSLNEAK